MVVKAKITEIKWDADQAQAEEVSGGKSFDVHFNPDSLKLSYSNKSTGGDQNGGSASQHLGSGSTSMNLELLFDTTGSGQDVRELTDDVAFFLRAKEQSGDAQPVPPGIRFAWGTFIFEGVVESVEESLEYFSEEGVPLRARTRLSLLRQTLEFKFGTAGGPGGSPSGGQGVTSGLESARQGDTARSLAARAGRAADWKSIAGANDIDDPLRLPAGLRIDTAR